jgi:hypothetical protein
MKDYDQCIKERKIRPIESTDDRSIEIVNLVKHSFGEKLGGLQKIIQH